MLEENGGVSKASIGVVLRSILTLEEAGAGGFFGESPFDVPTSCGPSTTTSRRR